MSIPSDWMADALIRDMEALAARAERLKDGDYSLSPAALERLLVAVDDFDIALDGLVMDLLERRNNGRAE